MFKKFNESSKLRYSLYIMMYVAIIIILYFPNLPVTENGDVQILLCNEVQCDDVLINLINNSNTVKCAFYDLKRENIIKALKDNSASVLIYDKNFHDGLNFTTKVSSKGLMHDKFCVFDDDLVLTGSWNPTDLGTDYNDNNIVLIKSKTIAKNYLSVYTHIKTRKTYSTKSKVNLKSSNGIIVVENHFCPKDNCENKVMQELKKAKYSIYFMTFSFTSKPIADALVTMNQSGIIVNGIFEKRQESKYSQYSYLNNSGIDVYFDNYKYTMHHKVFIIDNRTIITGSFNPTLGGNSKNDENLVILTNYNGIVVFLSEFERILSRSME